MSGNISAVARSPHATGEYWEVAFALQSGEERRLRATFYRKTQLVDLAMWGGRCNVWSDLAVSDLRIVSAATDKLLRAIEESGVVS